MCPKNKKSEIVSLVFQSTVPAQSEATSFCLPPPRQRTKSTHTWKLIPKVPTTKEIMSKTLHRSLEAKLAALDGKFIHVHGSWSRFEFPTHPGSNISSFFLLYFLQHNEGPEWDSSDDEENVQVISQEGGKKGKKEKKQKGESSKSNADGQQQPKSKKSKAEKAATKASKPSSVIYLGHLPHGFEEAEIRGFLNQFGSIRKLRLSRSKKSGNSRGYAFVQFVDPEVAAIVADTMSGYFLMEKRLVCHIMPRDKCHPELFAGHDRKFVKIDWQGLNREQVNKPRTAEGMKKITARLVKREAEKRKKLEALGIDYDFPGYSAGVEKGEAAGSTGGKRKRKSSKDEGNEDGGDENAPKTPKRRERKGSEVSTDGESSTKAKSAKKKSSKKKRKTSDADELDAIAEAEEIPKTKTPKQKSTSKRSATTEVKKAKKSGKKKRRDSVP